jgi:hypothetical protein
MLHRLFLSICWISVAWPGTQSAILIFPQTFLVLDAFELPER